MKKILSCAAFAALFATTAPMARGDLADIVPDGFARATEFTVNGYNGTTPLTNFPVLVKISAGSPTGFKYSDLMFPDTGDDLGFVDAQGNGLPFEIDEWNTNGTSVLWVTLPEVTHGTNFVMVYRSAQTGKSLNGNNPFADYVGVWHLGETASGETTIKDSTDNHLNGASHANSSPLAGGAIGGARRINTSDDNSGMDKGIQVSLGAATSAERATVDGIVPEFTASFWWRHPSGKNTRWNCVIGRKNGNADPGWGLQFDAQNSSYSPIRVFTRGENQDHCVKPAVPQTARETWYKVDLVYSYTVSGTTTNGNYSIYWNGVIASGTDHKDTYNKTLPGNPSGNFCIGGGGGRPYTGWMDEVRLRKFVPSSDWVRAEYEQATVDSYLTSTGVVEFVELPKPVISATRGDFGAAFAQFSGNVSQLGGTATSCDIYAKVWPVGGTEPASGTLLASGLVAGGTFTDVTVTGLTPQTEYQWKVYAVNDLEPTAYESDPVEGAFETAGVGGAGTGGVVSRVVDDYVHVFEIALDGTQTYEFTPPAGVTAVEALLVAGGGPGGFYSGGGGGAGGLVHDTAFALHGGTTYTVTVGDGGVPAAALTDYGTNGGDSLITSGGGTTTNAIAFGGGAGGNGPFNKLQNDQNAGRNGGSGGGSGYYTAAAGSGTTGQGSDGGLGLLGNGVADMTIKAGGGGGAGGVGGSAQYGSVHIPGTGGNGLQLDITGTATWYAGGGSGGGVADHKSGAWAYPVSGGQGGGGRGGIQSDHPGDEVATAGTDGLGGGGGGGSAVEGKFMGAAGGSGVVVVRYPATGTGVGATEPTVSLTGLEPDSANNAASLTYRVAWAGEGYQTADVSAIWGFSEDDLSHEVPLAANLIGRGSGTITGLPSVSRTVYVKVKATNAGNASGVSTETKTIALYNPAAPEATIENTSVSVSGGAFSVDVTSLGQGASSAVVSLQACANRAFASGVVTNADLATVTATGAVSVAATGLTDSSLWWVRAVVTNDIAQIYETDPVSITTLSPGYPNGEGSVSEIGYTSISALTMATARGLGSTETTRWLEVSENSDFSTLVGTSTYVTSPNVNANATLTITGLSPDTPYHVRIGISNTWNRTAYVLLTDFITRSEPFTASGPAWTAGAGTFDFSLNVSAVYDGAECTATLTYGGVEIGTISFDDPADDVSWGNVPAASDGAVAQIIVTATLPNDGGTFTKTYSARVAAGTNGAAVGAIESHCSAVGALWVRPGDVVALPTLFGDAFYQSLNERFATVDGNLLTAREPGIVGIRCGDAAHVTNVMGVVILPDKIGSGSIYVFKENMRNNSYDWARSVCWDKVENGARAASNDSYPQNADDIAILPFYTAAGDIYVRHLTDISLGGLYAGMIRPDTSVSCHLERYRYTDASNQTEATTAKTVTFRRTDGEPVRIQTCPNSEGGSYSRIALGGYDIDVVWACDAVIDGGSSETDVNGPRGRFWVKTAGSTNTLQGVTITFRGYPGNGTGSSECTDVLKGVWKGTGTIVKKGQGGIAFDGDFSSFSGTVIDMTGPTIGNLSAPAAGILMRAAGASNVTAHVYGYGSYNHDNGIMTYNSLSRGTIGTGGAGVTPDKGAQGPAKGLHLHGGTYRANKIDNTTWGVGVKDEKAFDVLSVGAGLNYVTLENGAGNGGGKPINAVTAKTLAHTDKGTLVVYDPSCNNVPAQSVTNSMVAIEDWADHVVGAAGDNQTTNVYPIVPWILVNRNSNFGSVSFASFDANGRIVQPIQPNTQINAVASEDSNALVDDKHLDNGAETNITVQSLCLNNASKNKWLGADRKLTVKSGGLVLNGNGTSIGQQGREDNGTLVLGDADKPAYVYAKAYGANVNQIWTPVTAAGGFVKSWPGNLVLGGVQTNIAEEIVVNAGTLALGNAAEDCALEKNLPVRVSTGATLILKQPKTLKRNPVYLDAVGDVSGRIDLSGVASASVRRLLVRDLTQGDEWTALRSGTYGSSDSNAAFVRDDLFVGNGVLNVSGQQPSVFMVQ